MQKSQRIELRVTELEKADWSAAAGGTRKVSDWLRAVANAAAQEKRTQVGSPAPKTRQHPIEHTGGRRSEPLVTTPQKSPSLADAKPSGVATQGTALCSRWQHHRLGVYCGTCQKVN